jgi:hypothetical protein
MESFQETLNILWTTGDAVTAEKMVCMYGLNALRKGWFKAVTIIIWGASAALVAENLQLQEKIREMIAEGVKVSACKACADQLGKTADLEVLGIEVRYWGEPMTRLLKEKQPLLTV